MLRSVKQPSWHHTANQWLGWSLCRSHPVSISHYWNSLENASGAIKWYCKKTLLHNVTFSITSMNRTGAVLYTSLQKAGKMEQKGREEDINQIWGHHGSHRCPALQSGLLIWLLLGREPTKDVRRYNRSRSHSPGLLWCLHEKLPWWA